jgi:hypothetical protein
MKIFLAYLLGFLILAFLIYNGLESDNTEKSQLQFRHEIITDSIPDQPGSRYGTPALADFDRDGDLDYVFSITRGSIFWMEYDQTEWKRHILGAISTAQLGGATGDIDRDGWIDLIAGGEWFRNSQNPGESEFESYTYDGAIDSEIHDILLSDVNGDGADDVIALGDKEGCFWYEIPNNPRRNADWKKHAITMDVLDENDDIHGGFFPQGVDDLDGDGDNDIVLPDRWLANDGSGLEWTTHPLPWGSRGPWGLSARSWVIDMDHDGDNDIIMVDCDQTASKAAWLENNGESPPEFSVNRLPQTHDGTRGSFHSLAVADFDNDGDMDIYTMEQQDTDILPEGAGPRGYLWENLDGKGREFTEHVIFDENLGGHDALAGDVDADGDIDITFKIWEKWSDSAIGATFHADWLENLALE